MGAYGRLNVPDGTRFQVVGVVEDVRNDGLDKPARARDLSAEHDISLEPDAGVVRSPLPAAQLIPEIRRAVHRSTRRCRRRSEPMNAIVGESSSSSVVTRS